MQYIARKRRARYGNKGTLIREAQGTELEAIIARNAGDST